MTTPPSWRTSVQRFGQVFGSVRSDRFSAAQNRPKIPFWANKSDMLQRNCLCGRASCVGNIPCQQKNRSHQFFFIPTVLVAHSQLLANERANGWTNPLNVKHALPLHSPEAEPESQNLLMGTGGLLPPTRPQTVPPPPVSCCPSVSCGFQEYYNRQQLRAKYGFEQSAYEQAPIVMCLSAIADNRA